MHGQVLVGERFNGGGCAVSPRAVLTARHVIRDRKDARLGFRLPTGRTVEVIRTEDDEQLDIAVLHLAEDVDATYVTTAVVGDEWRVLRPPPAGNDPELSGTVTSAARRIKNAQGHEVEVVQLLVDEDMREFSGYSGSAVVLPASGGVAAILVEQVHWRTKTAGRKPAASNVLYAVPVRTALARFGLTGVISVSAGLPLDTPIANLMDAALGSAQEPVPFGGRSAELADLTDWLRDPLANGRLLVTAAAGRGKSSLLIRWVDSLSRSAEWADGLSVVFVPISIAFEVATQDVVYRALVSRVARAYRTPVVVSGRGAEELRDELARLLHVRPPSGRLLIVVDGLDEAVGWDPGPHFLPHDLADGVRVVLSARHTADRPTARDWRDRIGWRRARTLELSGLTEEGVRDVLARQPGLRDGLPDPQGVAAELHRVSDGEPVVLRLYVDEMTELLQEKGRIPEPAALRSVERGLTAYFTRWWSDQEVQWRSGTGPPSADVGALLDTLAMAHGPLTRGEAAQVMRRLSDASPPHMSTGDRLDQALVALRRFLTRREGDHALMLAHPRYAAERQRRLREDDDFTRVDRAYLTWARESLRDVRKGRATADGIPAYLVRHLGQHLDRSGATERGLLLSLGSSEWRLAWDTKAEEVHGHLPDVQRALDGLTADTRREIPHRTGTLPVAAALGVAASRADTSAQADCLSPELAVELVRWGIWSESRAIGYVRGRVSDEERATAVGLLIPVLNNTRRAEIDALLDSARPAANLEFAEALSAYTVHLARTASPSEAVRVAEHQVEPPTSYSAGGRRRTYEEAYALVGLVSQMDDDLAVETCRKAVERIHELGGSRPDLLRRLTATVPSHQAARITAALGYRDPEQAAAHWLLGDRALGSGRLHEVDLLAGAVTVTAPWLSDRVRAERLSGMLDDPPDSMWLWAEVLKEVADHLTPELCRRVRSMAPSPTPSDQCRVYAALSRNSCPPDEHRQIVDFLTAHAETALNGGASDARRTLTDMARGGLGGLALRIIGRAEDRDRFWGALEAVAPALGEELIPEALRVATTEADAGRPLGLRAVLARWAGFGVHAAQAALAATYRPHLTETSVEALRASLATEPPVRGWTDTLRALENGALRFAALAGICTRFPVPPAEVRQLTAPLPSWMRDAARRTACAAMSRELDQDTVSQLISDYGQEHEDWQTPGTGRVFHDYFAPLIETAGPSAALACAERNGSPFAMACALSAAGPELSPTLMFQIKADARRQLANASVHGSRTKSAWRAANILTALLSSVPTSEADRLWDEVERCLHGEKAEHPSNLAWAAQLFHHVPEGLRDRAWDLLLPRGFAEGASAYPDDGDRDSIPVGWTTDVSALIDAFDHDRLAVLAETAERRVDSAGDRDELRAAIAVRSARLGDMDQALHMLGRCGWEPVCAAAAMDIAGEMRPESLREWIPAVLNRFSRAGYPALKAAVLASSSALQASMPLSTAAEVTSRWLAERQWLHRRELAAEAIGLAPMLLRLTEDGDALLAALRGDTSLKALRGLLV